MVADEAALAKQEALEEARKAAEAQAAAVAEVEALEPIEAPSFEGLEGEELTAAITDAEAAIKAAQEAVEAAQAKLANAKTAVEKANAEALAVDVTAEELPAAVDTTKAEAAVAAATTAITEAEAAVEAAKPAPTVKVASVSAINKTSVKVTYNEVPKTTPTVEELTVTVNGEKVTVTKVAKDGGDLSEKSFILTVDLNGKQGELAVNEAEAAEAIDFVAPVIAEVTPLSNTTLTVAFDEAVTDATALVKGNYSIFASDDPTVKVDVLSVKRVDEKTVQLTTAAQTKDKNYTVYVKNVADAKGNKSTSSVSKSFVAVKDEVAPTIASVQAIDANKVEITLDEDVKGPFTAEIKAYNEQGELAGEAIVNTTEVKDGNKLVVTTTNPAKFVADQKYNVKLTVGTDLSGNVINDNVDFVAVADKTAPTVVGNVELQENGKLKVTFSKPVTAAQANFAVFNSKTGVAAGGTLTVTPVADTNNTVYEVAFGTSLAANTDFSIRISGVTDLAADPNTITQVVKTFKTPEAPVTAITLADSAQFVAGEDGKTFTVKFKRALTGEELEAAKNTATYAITTGTGEDEKALEVKEVKTTDNTTFTLTTANQAAVTYKLTVKDIPNLSEVAANVTATVTGKDKVAPEVVSVTPLTTNLFEIEFDEDITISAEEDATKTTVTAFLKSDLAVSKEATVSAEGKKLTVEFTEADVLDAEKEYAFVIKNVSDASNNKLTSKQVDVKTIAADEVAPALVSSEVIDSNKLVLNFNEALTTAEGTDLKQVVTVEKYGEADALPSVVPTDVTISTTDNKQLVVQFAANTLENDAKYKVTVNEKTVAGEPAVTHKLTDFSGNSVKAVTTDVVGKADLVKPQLVSAVASKDNEITLTFDKEVDVTAESTAKFVITNVDTFEALAVKTAEVQTDKKVVKLTLNDNVKTVFDASYRIFVEGNAITDTSAQANQLNEEARIATFKGVDTTAPALEAAALNSSSKITLTFNEALDASSVQATDFEVKNDGVNVAVSAVKVTNEGKSVELTIAKQESTVASTITVGIKAGQEIKDAHGVKLGLAGEVVSLVAATALTDKAAPELVSAKVVKGEGDTVQVVFSEAITATDATGITVDGYTVAGVTVDGTVLTISVEEEIRENDLPLVTFAETNKVADTVAETPNKFVSGSIVPSKTETAE